MPYLDYEVATDWGLVYWRLADDYDMQAIDAGVFEAYLLRQLADSCRDLSLAWQDGLADTAYDSAHYLACHA